MGITELNPRARITILGKDLPMEDLQSVYIIDKIEENDEFRFVVYNRDRKYKGAFEKAQDIRIDLGYGDSLKMLVKGYTDEVRYTGSKSGELVHIKGTSIDFAGDVQSPENKTWENTNLKNIHEIIAKKMGLKAIDLTNILRLQDIKFDQIMQLKKNKLHFITDLAREYGIEMQVKDDKLIAREPVDKTSPPVAILEWGKNIISYEVIEKTISVPKRVEVTDYGPRRKETIEKKAETEPDIIDRIESVCSMNIPVIDSKEALQKAIAMQRKLDREEKKINISVPGQNCFRAGCCIEIKNIEHNGIYYIRQVTHTYDKAGGYKCQIEASNKK